MQMVHEPGKPLVLSVPGLTQVDEARGWLAENRATVGELLLLHGAVLLRGLPFASPHEFALLRDDLFARPATYVEKATPRSEYGEGVFSSTDVPARRLIRLHNENSYALQFPGTLLFGCLTAPERRGATTVGDVRSMMEIVPESVLDRFREVGWTLLRNYWGHLGLSWQKAFDTTDRDEVERYAATQGLSVEWVDGTRLRTRQTRPATIRHPVSGDESWFNHVAFWSEWTLEPGVRELLIGECGDDLPFRTLYGDGEPIPPETIDLLNKAYDNVQVAEPWQPGDLLMVDNIRMAHGREPYSGSRQVLVAMGDPVARAGHVP